MLVFVHYMISALVKGHPLNQLFFGCCFLECHLWMFALRWKLFHEWDLEILPVKAFFCNLCTWFDLFFVWRGQKLTCERSRKVLPIVSMYFIYTLYTFGWMFTGFHVGKYTVPQKGYGFPHLRWTGKSPWGRWGYLATPEKKQPRWSRWFM